MTKMRTAAAIAMSLALATGITGAATMTAPAALAAEAKGKTVRPTVGNPLVEAQKLTKANKNKEALEKALEAEKVSNRTPYENFMLYSTLSALYARNNDMANAIKSLESAQATGEMTKEQSDSTIKTIANSYYQLKNWPKVIEIGNKYLKEVSASDTDMLVVVAQAQYLQNNFKPSVDGIKQAISAARSQGKPVQSAWLQLLMSGYSKLGDDAGIQNTLEDLIAIDPQEQYWKNLVAYAQKSVQGQNSSTKTTLDIYAVKFQAGLLANPQDYSEMAQLAIQDGLPGLAKTVVAKGMSSGVLGTGAQKDREARLQTMANTQAEQDQKTLGQNETEARKARSGDPLVKTGEAYWSYGQYDKAAQVIQDAIAKGVTSKDDAQLRLGIVYVSAGKKAEAQTAFKAIAAGTPQATLAHLWMLSVTSPPKKDKA
jgi:hypothetical protein